MVVLQHFKIGSVAAGSVSQHKVQICLFMLLTSVYLNDTYRSNLEVKALQRLRNCLG
jgi:hypothetical protein